VHSWGDGLLVRNMSTLLPPNGRSGPYPGFVVPGHGMLIFDGDCGFCTSSAEWIPRGWGPGFEAVAWQHLGTDRLKSLGLTIRDTQEAAWWVDDTGGLFRGHRAIAKGLHTCRGWKATLGAALDLPPLSWFSAAIYPVVVRYRLPGGKSACSVNPPFNAQRRIAARPITTRRGRRTRNRRSAHPWHR
jgi:predicted DCC family thiol-disulfide oxidoreductase YuxK